MNDEIGPLPGVPRQASQSNDAPLPERAQGERGAFRILVVDDEPTLRHVIRQVLVKDGYDVSAVSSAEEALASFGDAGFSLVITDIAMGGMNGLDLLRRLKNLEPEVLVVVMTSQTSLENATAALHEGAYDFLTKPFEDLVLLSAVAARAMDRVQLQTRNRILTQQLQAYAEELERLNRDLKEQADRDDLTGLFNRRYFLHALDVELARSTRHQRPFSLILLDVDHFKRYNDAQGHPAGDEALRTVARVLREASRTETLCGRYGGEEFVVLLPEADPGGALACAERIRAALEGQAIAGREAQPLGKLTASLGVASFPVHGRDSEELLRRADEALYQAKRSGRNQVRAAGRASIRTGHAEASESDGG